MQVDLLTWSLWFEKAERHVAQDYVGQLWVSTVFLGLDHNFGGGGPPLLFETMIFSDELEMESITCNRYSTWEEAEKGHQVAIRYARMLWRKVDMSQPLRARRAIPENQ